jgi:integrase
MRVLSEEEATNYVIFCKGDLQDFATIALDTGARPGEILSLRVEDVHSPEGHVHVHGTKTEKSIRDIPMSPAVQEVLERRMVESKNGYIFPARRPKTKNLGVGHISSLKKAHEAVIEEHFKDNPFVPYDLRHTFATRQVQLGTELPVLAALMGHSDLSTTMRYIHPARDLKMAAIDRVEKLAKVAAEFKKKLLEGSEHHAIITQQPLREGSSIQVSAL